MNCRLWTKYPKTFYNKIVLGRLFNHLIPRCTLALEVSSNNSDFVFKEQTYVHE